MHRLTEFVIDQALAPGRRLAAARAATVAVAVNVSARDLHGTRWPRTVSEALARAPRPAAALMLEITERTLMAEHPRASSTP